LILAWLPRWGRNQQTIALLEDAIMTALDDELDDEIEEDIRRRLRARGPKDESAPKKLGTSAGDVYLAILPALALWCNKM